MSWCGRIGLGLALAVCACGPADPGGGPRLVRNVILISIDTLRADRLETYGYGRPTSAGIESIAKHAVVFPARAQASPLS